jgi:hypothetical protein
MLGNSISDYQLREMKRGWQVVIPRIRGGKVRGYQTYSPIYRDKAKAEEHLAMRLESARQFQQWCAGVMSAMARERESAQ